MKAFREGKVDVLVATDAFARGMDVVGVGNVINYDMPTFTKTYVHRAGRTARADQTGCCFTLMRKSQVMNYILFWLSEHVAQFLDASVMADIGWIFHLNY